MEINWIWKILITAITVGVIFFINQEGYNPKVQVITNIIFGFTWGYLILDFIGAIVITILISFGSSINIINERLMRRYRG